MPEPDDAFVLLSAARDAIEAAVHGRREAPAPEESRPTLSAHRASFVTLRSPDGSLRGCIGELVAQRMLTQSVRGCAVSAATRDPRFRPVEPAEVDGLHIGISVLTPPRPISAQEIEVGVHGLLVERGNQRGVLLPEVATEQGWDARTFLVATCRKAGLADDAWRDPDVRISAFETIKLAE